MAKILIVEDNQGTNKAICEYMKEAGHTLFSAFTGSEALKIFREEELDIIVLDIMLPEMSGIVVLHEIRKVSNIPVIMLTALDDEYTQSNSFDEMADDYITKPFSMLILGKRITALLRRSQSKPAVNMIKLGDVTVDFSGYTACDENGKIDITPKELEILKVLIDNKGLVLSRNQILDDVWGYDCDVIDRTIDAYIRNIRKKLRLDCITTVKGIGYKFEMGQEILIYIYNDAFDFNYSALADFPNCAIPKCTCYEYGSNKCRGKCSVRSRYAPAHYSNYVENISDFYILLRHYIGIVFILFFKRHNHSDIIALQIRKSNVEIGARRKSGCIVNG